MGSRIGPYEAHGEQGNTQSGALVGLQRGPHIWPRIGAFVGPALPFNTIAQGGALDPNSK
jgi:hypothetical protein